MRLRPRDELRRRTRRPPEEPAAPLAAPGHVARPKRPGRQAARVVKALDEVGDRFVGNSDGDWTDATPATFLGLYAYLHKAVYNVSPDDLADDWFPAHSSAQRCLEKDFNGSVELMVDFMRWTWSRTRVIRKKNPDSDFRVTWRYQFSRKLITDYKVARSRK